MHESPTRLRHDPDSPPGLREALDAEQSRALPHDLGALRASLDAEIARGAPASAALGPKLLLGLLALGALGGAWALTPNDPEPPRSAAEATPEPAVDAVSASDPAPEPTSQVPRAAAAPTPEAPAVAEAPPDPAPTPVYDRAAPPAAAEAAEDDAPETGLAAQLAQYERAQRLLADGEASAAADAFAEYGRRFPDGDLRAEARLGQLEALHEAEAADAAAALARVLLEDPAFRARRGDILRVLAEAEVLRGRCESAEVAFAKARASGVPLTSDGVAGALQACVRRTMR